LNLLETVKGKFLLSSFRNNALTKFIKRNGWHTVELKMAQSMTHGRKTKRQKVEALTANYPIPVNPNDLGKEGSGKRGRGKLEKRRAGASARPALVGL
jgi:DNA adenine methylase